MNADMRLSDDQIDEAARALTEGTPPANFKARVLTRIQNAGPVQRFAWRPVAVASAAVAIVVLGVVVSRSPEVRLEPAATNARDTSVIQLKPASSAVDPEPVERVEGPSRAARDGGPGRADGATEVRLPPSRRGRYGGPGKADATREVRLKPDTTPESVPTMENALPPIEVADIDMRPLDIAALGEPDPMAAGDIAIASIEVAPLESITSQFD
jgi:hypothetical protein